jgi:hypothetical protein
MRSDFSENSNIYSLFPEFCKSGDVCDCMETAASTPARGQLRAASYCSPWRTIACAKARRNQL